VNTEIFDKVKKAIDIELESIHHFRDRLDTSLVSAIELILSSKGRVILTGVGKSGDIAKKISSTLTSTGTTSIFLHPTDAAHGDAGCILKEDIVIAIGKSGESDELLNLLPTIKKIGAKLISITANPASKLAKESDIHIFTPVLKEACPLKLAPTSSTTIALITGDAIAMALMELRSFKEENFALYHPAGRLGKRLSLTIEDVMRKKDRNAFVFPDSNINDILNEISEKSIGATSVVDHQSMKLLGFITDFDIRKSIQKGLALNTLKAEDIMNRNPIRYTVGTMAYTVLTSMEDRPRPISVVPIIDEAERVVGIVSLHDLLQIGLK
jgi:arabinose-5-phosphate isomerase